MATEDATKGQASQGRRERTAVIVLVLSRNTQQPKGEPQDEHSDMGCDMPYRSSLSCEIGVEELPTGMLRLGTTPVTVLLAGLTMLEFAVFL